MSKLEDISEETLRTELAEVDGAKSTKRLMVALAYKDDVSVDRLSTRYGFPTSTIYSWLDRFTSKPIEDAIGDDKRPGRPSKLAPRHRRAIERWLSASPREYGIDADEWSGPLLRDRIQEEFDVEYSLGHAYRLMAD